MVGGSYLNEEGNTDNYVQLTTSGPKDEGVKDTTEKEGGLLIRGRTGNAGGETSRLESKRLVHHYYTTPVLLHLELS